MSNWADQFNTYDEACHYYGVDTPAQAAAEEHFWAVQEELGGHPHVYDDHVEIENWHGAVVRYSPTFATREEAALWLAEETAKAELRVQTRVILRDLSAVPSPSSIDLDDEVIF